MNKNESKSTRAFDKALDYLSYKARTEREIREYLEKKDYWSKVIEETIAKLKEYGYVNDRAYVERTAENNAFGNRYGKMRISRELKRRGISDEYLELLEELIPDDDEAEFCQYHFQKVLKRTEGQPAMRRIPKIQDYLMRRGFTREQYSTLLQSVPRENIRADSQDFQKHFVHYIKLYTRKGCQGQEFRQRVIKAMLGRGYKYDAVKEALETLEE